MLPFFTKRKENNDNSSKILFILDRLQVQEKLQEEQRSIQREDFQRLLTRQRKSETMMENILETLEEYRAALEEQNSMRSKEKVLIGYINSYDGSLHQIEQMLCEAMGEDSAWVKQLHGMREQLCDSMIGSELRIIRESDIPVDFAMHEVIGICATEQKEKNNCICKVISPGVSFQGEVFNKAKITAYQYKEDTIG